MAGKGRLKGFRCSEETKQKMREHHKGFTRPHTDEEKLKTSASMLEWYKTHYNARKGKRTPDETRRKMSLVKQGSRHNNWKGGLTELVRGIRRSPEFYQWRKSILERDNHTCQDCGVTEKLDAHHIQAVIDYPEGIFDVDNGLTLCRDCHRRHTFWQRLNGKARAKH